MIKRMFVVITLLLVNGLLADNAKAYNIHKAYSVGDQVQVAGENYYVIEDSGVSQKYVTLLKEEPLLYSEIKSLIQSTEVATQIEKDNQDNTGYLKMQYLYSDTCSSIGRVYEGCTTDYDLSSVKQVVDVWADNKFKNNELMEVNGYQARLITFEELLNNLGYDKATWIACAYYVESYLTPPWVYNSQYYYFTMSQYEDDVDELWEVRDNGSLFGYPVYDTIAKKVVRPVINVSKDADKFNGNEVTGEKNEETSGDDTYSKDSSNIVKVDNTLLRKSMVMVIIGLVVIGIGITTYIVIMKKKK